MEIAIHTRAKFPMPFLFIFQNQTKPKRIRSQSNNTIKNCCQVCHEFDDNNYETSKTIPLHSRKMYFERVRHDC